MVMALWFCEIRAREMLNYGQYQQNHMRNPFLSRAERQKRVVVNIDELIAAQERHFVQEATMGVALPLPPVTPGRRDKNVIVKVAKKSMIKKAATKKNRKK